MLGVRLVFSGYLFRLNGVTGCMCTSEIFFMSLWSIKLIVLF